MIVAQEETLRLLRRAADPNRPLPTVTFSDRYTLRVGNKVLELSYHGNAHAPGNIFIYAPARRVLMVVDVVFPGWMPWRRFALAQDIRGYFAQVEEIRQMEWETLVGGHVARTGTHADVDVQADRYWPALYFVDARGRVRHHHFGEGEYERSERVIQQLLAEAGAGGAGRELVSVDARGIEAAAHWGSLKSPENYVGHERTENFASPGGAIPGKSRVYAAPAQLGLNRWALAGDWTVGKVAAVLNKAGGRIAYGFHARDLHLVMGPAARGTSVRFRVALDGQPPRAAHGVDVDDQGHGTVTGQRLYQLIRQPKPVTDRRFEIEFLDAGAEAFAFTFG